MLEHVLECRVPLDQVIEVILSLLQMDTFNDINLLLFEVVFIVDDGIPEVVHRISSFH